MRKSPHTRYRVQRRLVFGLLLSVLALATVAGCGAGGDGGGEPAPDYAAELAGAPAPLAAIHKQSDELLDGGIEAFDSRIAELEGYPVVVNVWASWCGPCRAEFPHFQELGAKLGKKVAFLGVDSDDDADAAATFLRDNPVPYPSYSDPDKEIYDSLEAAPGFPATAFFDAEGNRTYTKHGQYPDMEALEEDIRAYAIEGGEGPAGG
jgi:cytochrome c biogenesis protein CcmG/thiol:disulfide interchange protein DsbE